MSKEWVGIHQMSSNRRWKPSSLTSKWATLDKQVISSQRNSLSIDQHMTPGKCMEHLLQKKITPPKQLKSSGWLMIALWSSKSVPSSSKSQLSKSTPNSWCDRAWLRGSMPPLKKLWNKCFQKTSFTYCVFSMQKLATKQKQAFLAVLDLGREIMQVII